MNWGIEDNDNDIALINLMPWRLSLKKKKCLFFFYHSIIPSLTTEMSTVRALFFKPSCSINAVFQWDLLCQERKNQRGKSMVFLFTKSLFSLMHKWLTTPNATERMRAEIRPKSLREQAEKASLVYAKACLDKKKKKTVWVIGMSGVLSGPYLCSFGWGKKERKS